MPDLALIVSGVVEAVARDATPDPDPFGDAAGERVAFDAGLAVPGMLWDGSTLSPPPLPSPVPHSVSMRQARLALLGAGLLDLVNGLIATQSRAAQIEWEYATDVWRDRDLVLSLSAAIPLTSDQVDALFIAAKAIP